MAEGTIAMIVVFLLSLRLLLLLLTLDVFIGF